MKLLAEAGGDELQEMCDRAKNEKGRMTPEFQRLFAGYYCVFVGDPKKCTPYACFATHKQAENLNKIILGKYPVMTVEEWEKQHENTDA